MFDIYRNGLVSKDDDLSILKSFDKYANEKDDRILFSYDTSTNHILNKLLPSIWIEKKQTSEDDFNLMVEIMVWVYKTLIPSVDVIPQHPLNSVNILEQTKNYGKYSNCWMYATVLNEIFLSLGYKSKMIRCMPIDLRFDDCHCVTQAYCDSLNKWIVFDAALCTYYSDENKVPISLCEFRKRVIKNQPVKLPLITAKKASEIIDYWIKNLFRFEAYSSSKFNIEETVEDKIIYQLIPLHYKLIDKELDKGRYTIKIIYTNDDKSFWEEENENI